MRTFLGHAFLIVVVTNVVLLSGCQNINKQQIGTAVGGAIGGVVGNKVGNNTLGTVIGAGTGAIAGNLIGKYLDERDREEQMQAQQQALNTGTPQTWVNNQTGNSGQVMVVNTAPQTLEAAKGQQKNCKTIRRTITWNDGSQHEEDVTACKGANGWETI